MRIARLTFLAALILSAFALAAEKVGEFKLIHVPDVVALEHQKDAHVHLLDANTQEFREKNGVLPGAQLLSSFNKYDLDKELPSDKDATLIFYCSDTRCRASHQAAGLAVDAGYKNVKVLADGLNGWKAAGQPVVMPK